MMQSTLEMVKEMGGSVIYAHMEAQNDPALGLYKKYGFEVVKEMQQMDPAASPGGFTFLFRCNTLIRDVAFVEIRT